MSLTDYQPEPLEGKKLSHPVVCVFGPSFLLVSVGWHYTIPRLIIFGKALGERTVKECRISNDTCFEKAIMEPSIYRTRAAGSLRFYVF